MRHYDYEWITNDLNNSIVITLVNVNENGEIKLHDSYQAIDVIDIVGNDVSVGLANVNDLSNLLLLGTMRFKGIGKKGILDISFSNLYKLYENANRLLLEDGKFEVNNRLISLGDLNAFTVVDGTMPTDNYKVIATIVGELPLELERLLKLARDYGMMSMDEKFCALSEINQINENIVNKEKKFI